MSIKKVIKAPLLVVYKFGLKTFGGRGLQKIWPLGIIRDWLSKTVRGLKPESVYFRGNTVFLDPNDNLELSIWKESWSVQEIEVMKANIEMGDTVIDVGANIGAFTLLFAQQVGLQGHVFAFEPSPENVSLLQKNVSANGYPNVKIIPKAVTDKDGKVTLFLSDYNVGDHRIYDPHEKSGGLGNTGAEYERLKDKTGRRKSVSVEVVSLDNYFRRWEKAVEFVKIDVQGAEATVCAGMSEIIRKNLKIKIMIEFWPAGLTMSGANPKEFLEKLREVGFSFFEIDGWRADSKAIGIEDLLKRYTVENNKTTNLLIKKI